MGKWAKITRSLPDLPDEEPGRQAQVDEIKKQIRSLETHTPESLTKYYKRARFGSGPELTREERTALMKRLGRDGVKDLLSNAQLSLTAVEQMLIESNKNDEPGWGTHGAKDTTVKVASGESVSVQPEPEPKVINREEFRLWCLSENLDRSMVLHSSTAKSIVKQRLEKGLPDPPGIQSYTRYKIVFRKPGQKDAGDE